MNLFPLGVAAVVFLEVLLTAPHVTNSWPLLGLSGSQSHDFRLSVLNTSNCSMAGETVYYTTTYVARWNLLEMPVDFMQGRIYAVAWDPKMNTSVILEFQNPAIQGGTASTNLTLHRSRVFHLPPDWTGLSVQLDQSSQRLLVAGIETMSGTIYIRVGAIDLSNSGEGAFSDLAVLPGTPAYNGACAVFDSISRLLLVPTHHSTAGNASDYEMFFYSWLNVDTLESGRYSELSFFSESIMFATNQLVGVFWKVQRGITPQTSDALKWAVFYSADGSITIRNELPAAATFPVSLVMSHSLERNESEPIYWAVVTHPVVDDAPWTRLLSVSMITGASSWSKCFWRIGVTGARPDAILAWPWPFPSNAQKDTLLR